MTTIPKTLQQALDMGYETAPLDDFNKAIANHPGTGVLGVAVNCKTASEGTVCTYVPCFEGWEYISTCFKGVCKPGWRRRC